jgi:hypothetical protein
MAPSAIQWLRSKARLSLFVTVMTTFAVAQVPSSVAGAAPGGRGIDLLVTDPSGAVVSAAQVRVAKRNGEQIAEGRTSDYGRFRLSGLAADTYSVTVLAAGFVANTQTVSVPQHGLIGVGAVLQFANKYTPVYVGGPNHLVMIDTIRPPYWNDLPFELSRRAPPILADVEILPPSHP